MMVFQVIIGTFTSQSNTVVSKSVTPMTGKTTAIMKFGTILSIYFSITIMTMPISQYLGTYDQLLMTFVTIVRVF